MPTDCVKHHDLFQFFCKITSATRLPFGLEYIMEATKTIGIQRRPLYLCQPLHFIFIRQKF